MQEEQQSINGISIDPQKNIIPSGDIAVAELISAEANYDRWSSFLFPHSKSQNIYGRRKKQWEVQLPDGSVSKSMIEVIPAQDEKSYTTKTYDIFLALTMIWKEKNMPIEPIEIFLSDIAKKLDLSPNGKVLNSIVDELRCLEETKVSWIFSFRTKASTEETYKGQRVLNLFNYVKIRERSRNMTVSGKCTVRFSDHIMDNIRNDVTVPVNLSARKSIKSEVAKALYNRIDSILAKMDRHEKTARNLVKEYDLKADRYKYKSQRKSFTDVIVRNLDGIPLSSINAFLYVEIQETSDKQDWKCVFTKRAAGKQVSSRHNKIENRDPHFREYLIDLIEGSIGGKKENYRLYKLFALYYSENLILRAIGEYKELIALGNIKNKKGYFTAIMHTLCHKLNKDWINPCDKNCKYRPENQLFPNN